MIEYIALTNFFSFKATKEDPHCTFSGEEWWTEINDIKLLKTISLGK
jgi:hypothetical protein